MTPEQMTDAISLGFKDRPVMDEDLEAMHINGAEVDKTEVGPSKWMNRERLFVYK